MRPHELHASIQSIKKIFAGALFDAQEILVLRRLLQVQNEAGVNASLNEAGAGGAAIIVRNALIARLVLLVSRCFPKSRTGDRHLREAVELLKDGDVRTRFSIDENALSTAIDSFSSLLADHRQERIKNFRDKFTAHLGDPEDKPMPNFKELFDFSTELANCIEALARAVKLTSDSVSENADADNQAQLFWGPWIKDRPKLAIADTAEAK
ncbi:hypothetical protein [Tardiphaga sp.]|jgi:hypothetical protein|uniref:AbiU2 domain-containing protein n=1 Tax=Tardiphaga sp. TaxID=1926292 RepID=UPI0037DA5E5C